MDPTSPQSSFLRSVWRTLSAKRKSLRHRGDFALELDIDEHGEWIVARFKRAGGPIVEVQLLDSGFANVYVQSIQKADRNKMLFRRELLRVLGNGSRVGETIVQTLRLAEYSEESHRAIDLAWKNIQYHIVRDD